MIDIHADVAMTKVSYIINYTYTSLKRCYIFFFLKYIFYKRKYLVYSGHYLYHRICICQPRKQGLRYFYSFSIPLKDATWN